MYNYIIYLIKIVQILLEISSILLFLFNIFILNQFSFFIINFKVEKIKLKLLII